MIFCDKNFLQWTIRKREGFLSFSDFFRKHYGDKYGCNNLGQVYPTKAKVIKFSHLTSIMKSKDEALYRDFKWMWDGEFRFLDKTESMSSDHGNHVCFTSFCRSGNSFLRRYVEQISGITTGSSLSLFTSTSLQIMGMKGESCTDDSIWVAKSHHPF